MLFALSEIQQLVRRGYMGAPKAIPDDGLLDFIIVRKTVGRLKLAGLLNAYKRGEHSIGILPHFCAVKKCI